jgi:hypothetical protein
MDLLSDDYTEPQSDIHGEEVIRDDTTGQQVEK